MPVKEKECPKDTRSLICLLTGHIDHGKSQIIETITGNSILKKEAGRITQKISVIDASSEVIKKICGPLLNKINLTLGIPSLLFIDSPGHASFTNLRKRGGNIADIAVLVIDINEGIKLQTLEALDILKRYKTPFIIAANKIDLIHGWSRHSDYITEDLQSQNDSVISDFNQKLYSLVGELYKQGFNAETFDKVRDYTKEIAIIPVSAKTGEGLPELLMVLTGLSQKFLESELKMDREAPAKGVIIELKKEKGIGTVLHTVLYEGKLKVGDKVIIGGIDEAIETKVKFLFPCHESRKQEDEVYAASAVDVVVTETENLFSGMPLRVANKDTEKVRQEVQSIVDEVIVETDNEGVVVKADSLGSLEAIIHLLKENNIQIKRASIGDVSKSDIATAKSDAEEINKVVLGFNVQSVASSEAKIILGDVIYTIVGDLLEFRKNKRKELEDAELTKLVKPFKLKFMASCTFRQNNPAIVGVEVLAGKLTIDIKLLKTDGSVIPNIASIQLEGKSVNDVEAGKQVAVSIPGATVGRQIHEGDLFYSEMDELTFRKLKDMKKLLNSAEIETLKEIADIKRKQNPIWGV